MYFRQRGGEGQRRYRTQIRRKSVDFQTLLFKFVTGKKWIIIRSVTQSRSNFEFVSLQCHEGHYKSRVDGNGETNGTFEAQNLITN